MSGGIPARDAVLFKLTAADFDDVIRVHLRGTAATAHHAAVHWRQRAKDGDPGGRLINTTSPTGLYGNAGQANYAAAKAGIIGLTLTASIELERYGVTVNVLAPLAASRLLASVQASAAVATLDPAHVARVAVWLCVPPTRSRAGFSVSAAGGSTWPRAGTPARPPPCRKAPWTNSMRSSRLWWTTPGRTRRWRPASAAPSCPFPVCPEVPQARLSSTSSHRALVRSPGRGTARSEAKRAVPDMVWAYVDSGAEDLGTLRANRAAFGRYSLRTRVLTGNEAAGLSVVVAGQEISLPVLFAPTGMAGLSHWTGEVGMAQAAERGGTLSSWPATRPATRSKKSPPAPNATTSSSCTPGLTRTPGAMS